MTTSKQTLQERIEKVFLNEKLDIYWTEIEHPKLMNKLLSLFKQTVEKEIIQNDEKLSKEHAMSESIRNNFRASQRQKLQEILK